MPYKTGYVRPVLNIFYVLDTSGSMQDKPDTQPITTLNRAMLSTIETLQDEAPHNRDAEIRIAVLEFNTSCRWISPNGPERLNDFFWEDLEAAGLTAVGAALNELNSKLTDKPGGFINNSSGGGVLMPVIIFMTDGHANDDYKKALERIRQNKWFSRATRVGFAIGKDPDMEMISKVVGDAEAVMRTEDLNRFAAMLKWASVTSSMLSSKTSTSGSGNLGRDAMRTANEYAGYAADDLGHNYDYREEPVEGGSWGPTSDDVFSGTDEFYSNNPF